MSSLLNKLLSLRHIEYLVVDRNFNIIEVSSGVKRFADCPNEVMKGKNVRLSFPEIVGLENSLIALIEGREASFELKGIGRSSVQEEPLYIDIYFINEHSEENLENRLILFFEDVTERMILEQKLVQRCNEVSLLLEAWAACNDYLGKIILSMKDALVVTTSLGIIKTVNQAAQDLFGYREEELIGQPISIILSEENLLLKASNQPFIFDQLFNNVKIVCQTKSGEKIAIAFSCSAIQTNIEDLQDFIYVGRELTDC